MAMYAMFIVSSPDWLGRVLISNAEPPELAEFVIKTALKQTWI
jgi:hypothetical protein